MQKTETIARAASGARPERSQRVEGARPERAQRAEGPLKVAIVGFGTVGRSVAKILCENSSGALHLTHVCNRNFERKKQAWVPADVIWTDDFQVLLNSDADIIIELIGGLNPAEQFVRGALQAGKSVVTANKQLIARHGQQFDPGSGGRVAMPSSPPGSLYIGGRRMP